MESSPPAPRRVAFLALHAHRDKSHLDDRDLAVLSGDLRDDGLENDLVLATLAAPADEDRLAGVLLDYDVVVFDRFWSRDALERLRARLPGRAFVWVLGEHDQADPPADWAVRDEARLAVSHLVRHLRAEERHPPRGAERRSGTGAGVPVDAVPAAPRPRRFAPNLRPRLANPDEPPPARTFSVLGNAGCPWSADARLNPCYAGVALPDGVGRGCAFCRTGERYSPRPAAEVAASVLEQIRWVRREAPHLDRLVLKDQCPFAWLPAVLEGAAAERLGPFTLLLETRADWLVRAADRFERALEAARAGGLRLSPFLVGIESFSQPELERFNKGTTAADNIAFLEALEDWERRAGPALDLESCSFGFILFTPWTTLADLATNRAAIRRTRLDRRRGGLLLTRARLYPETALYHLAARDGLLEPDDPAGDESARRYGYLPPRPWRFQRPEVAHFATLAARLSAETGGRDELVLFEALLDAFARAADWRHVSAPDVLAEWKRRRAAGDAPAPAGPELRRRFLALAGAASDGTMAGGWRLAALEAGSALLRATLERAGERLVVELGPPTGGACAGRSRRYEVRAPARTLGESQQAALRALADAVARNDR